MKTKTIIIEDNIEQNLEEIAQKTGQSIDELIKEAINLYLTYQKKPLPRSMGMGASGMKNLASKSEELLWTEK